MFLAPARLMVDKQVSTSAVWRSSRTWVKRGAAWCTGIRFRENGPATGPGGHHSTLSRFEVSRRCRQLGVAIAAPMA